MKTLMNRAHSSRGQLSQIIKRSLRFGLLLICLSLVGFLSWPGMAIADTEPADALFTANCAACHANGGNIIRRGKNLKQKALKRHGYEEVSAIMALVNQGKGAMPAYADRLTPDEIEAIALYVQQQAAEGW